jgi:hypothetical protein
VLGTGIASIALALLATADDPPRAPTVADLEGARALSISAYRGIAPGNDGIFTNAAGLAARRRYALEVNYLLDRAGADADAQFIGASVVDSQSGAVTGAFAYNRIPMGSYQGGAYHVAFAFPMAERFYVGVTGKYLSLDGPGTETVRVATVDASFFWQAASLLSIGAAGYNLIPVGHAQVASPALGAGVSVGSDRIFHVAADWRADFRRRGTETNAYSVGAELLLGDLVPVRAGFLHDETLGGKFWSAGLGIVSSSGVAIDVGYRQSIDDPSHRAIAAALKLFLFAQ